MASPDGTYLIVGGGQHGLAGFGLGGAPNFNAGASHNPFPLLSSSSLSLPANPLTSSSLRPHKTRQPTHVRNGQHNSSRLLPHEAIVLLDGRVMVSGPTHRRLQSPANSWRKKYRVEVSRLPTSSLEPRAKLHDHEIDWRMELPCPFTSSWWIKVSLLEMWSSTHGIVWGRDAVSCCSCRGLLYGMLRF